MDITFLCPNCNQSLTVDGAGAGLNVPCPKCGQSLTIPPASVTAPKPTRITTPEESKPTPKYKRCPYCAEEILAEAKKCRFCGEMLDPTMKQTPPPQQSQPTKATYNPSSDTFTGTMTLLVKLAMRAIQELGWKLENANENLGMVTFETGVSWGSWSGISCSLNIEEVSTNQFRVTGTGKQNVRGGQLLALNLGGEAQGRARKAIDKMKELAR